MWLLLFQHKWKKIIAQKFKFAFLYIIFMIKFCNIYDILATFYLTFNGTMLLESLVFNDLNLKTMLKYYLFKALSISTQQQAKYVNTNNEYLHIK